MNTAEIIMQQKKIAAEKENAEKQLAYDTIKQWTETNAEKWARGLLNRIAKRFSTGFADKVRYHCTMGTTNYPLGEGYPKDVGAWWEVEYWKNGRRVGEYGFGYVKEFFEENPIEKTKYAEGKCELFVGQMLFHTALPELLKSEGFAVQHNGCGCCEEIIVTLPEE